LRRARLRPSVVALRAAAPAVSHKTKRMVLTA
jgi:hypothetical protein